MTMRTSFKYLILCNAFACFAQLQSTAATLPRLPESVFADTEVSTNVALKAWSENVRTFRVSLSLEATASNNVQIAIGSDASGDGLIDDGEVAFVFGWDCGNWFIEGHNPASRSYAEPANTDPGRKTLLITMQVKADGFISSVGVSEGNYTVDFQTHEDRPVFPSEFSVKDWDTAKLVARGAGIKDESITVDFKNDATIFSIR